jgi:hypothetical protein
MGERFSNVTLVTYTVGQVILGDRFNNLLTQSIRCSWVTALQCQMQDFQEGDSLGAVLW